MTLLPLSLQSVNFRTRDAFKAALLPRLRANPFMDPMFTRAKFLLAVATVATPASFNSMLPGWFAPSPEAFASTSNAAMHPSSRTDVRAGSTTPTTCQMPNGLPRPVLAATLIARVAWHTGEGAARAVWATLANAPRSMPPPASTETIPSVRALSAAWRTLALQSRIPFLIGETQVRDGVQVLVLSPIGKTSNPGALLPVCASFEGSDNAPHDACALVAESGGSLTLPGATSASWVTASIDTPQGPRLAMAPTLLAHALHVAPSMPASALARLAGSIDSTTREGIIEPADCVAALMAIGFASHPAMAAPRAAPG
ncbi:hypothetical protein ABIE56_000298 [Luteibacter sp. 621]|uniref:hypothetical protein n=1 Tax=Luteibacter sp. 621 TaxID=3373916 RepID=UPI003D1DF52F